MLGAIAGRSLQWVTGSLWLCFWAAVAGALLGLTAGAATVEALGIDAQQK